LFSLPLTILKNLMESIQNIIKKTHDWIIESSLFPEYIPTQREQELIDKLAKFVIDRQLQIPAISFLETFKPVGFIGSQFGIFASPFLGFFGDAGVTTSELLVIFENTDNIERLIRKIEESLK